jgi:hypothetical protein
LPSVREVGDARVVATTGIEPRGKAAVPAVDGGLVPDLADPNSSLEQSGRVVGGLP